MAENKDDEMKDLRLYSNEGEDGHTGADKSSSEQVADAEHLKTKEQQNGDAVPTSLNPQEWPLASNNDTFTELCRSSMERELTVSSPDEENNGIKLYENKTDITPKDVFSDGGKEENSISASALLTSVNLREVSLPVSLKIESNVVTNSATEINNNVDDIQPQFKELSLHSPTSTIAVKKKANAASIKCFRFFVEASCAVSSTSGPEMLNIFCEPVLESMNSPSVTSALPKRYSDSSSGHLGDISKTVSSSSESPITYVGTPPTRLTRMSYGSSSSNSSLPSSAAALAFHRLIRDHVSNSDDHISQARINYLSRKWKNAKLVYSILDYIDQAICAEPDDDNTSVAVEQEHQPSTITTTSMRNLEVLPEVSNPLSSRKRHPSTDEEDEEDPVSSKRLKCSTPIASTSGDDLLGIGVFAKWQNRKYYFAHIIDTLSDGRIRVVFLDSTVRVVRRDHVITELELLVGHKVMVTDDSKSDKYHPGIVTASFTDVGVTKYAVATNKGDFEVSVAQVYFTEHQAKLIKQSAQSWASDSSETSSGLHHPGCSGIQKDSLCCDTLSSETEGSPVKIPPESDTFIKHVIGCDVETNDPQNLNPSVKLKNVQGKLPKRCNKNEDSLLGPLKFKGTWFKGLYFLVTCSTHVATASNDSTEEIETDSEDYPFTTVPFVCDRLIQQIKLGGGHVFDKFEDAYPARYSDTYLVTNRPCLTPKYLKCLAAGITILCHEWIVNCTIKQKRLPLQDLPAGWSLEKSCFFNMFERKTSIPFSSLRIQLAQLTDRNFYKFWSDICTAVGASVSQFMGNFENTDVIVAENGLKDPKLDNANCSGVPVVSATWIVQSIIHGEVRPYGGHAFYNHLCEETEEF